MIATSDDGSPRFCAAYLELADRLAPGLVEGLYHQGSVALGDYRPGVSDFVAMTGRRPPAGIVSAIHAGLRRDLERAAAGPAEHEWRMQAASRFERHLVAGRFSRRPGSRCADLVGFVTGVLRPYPSWSRRRVR
ncbi:hypothetical protein [Actinoplanes sp. NPDC049118]|uniref:hypothetical protein n=1 Tax=Actinoplanes sp. NPDC049118 TaxID=3155769 RepID=UPI0033CCE743